jgi:serine/threonine protein kinase
MAKMRTQINSLMPRSIDYLCAVCKRSNTLNRPPGQQTLCQHSDCGRRLGLEVKNNFYFLLQGAGDGNYGNYGHVYKAQKLGNTKNFYAVKIFHQNLNQISLEKSLNREIKCLKNLNDKGARVPKYIDHLCPSQITEATPYVVVLEYIDGKNLEKFIQERGRNLTNGNILFKEEEIFNFLIDLLETLHLIHQKGETIHRDIKPENIVKQEKTNKLYLVDFGSAKVLELVDNYQTDVAFSRAYATPELFLSK